MEETQPEKKQGQKMIFPHMPICNMSYRQQRSFETICLWKTALRPSLKMSQAKIDVEQCPRGHITICVCVCE